MKSKEEKCNELFSLEKEVKDKKKKSPLKKIIAIILSVIILAGIIVFAVFQTNYEKNKNFTNGIQGKYYCTDTSCNIYAMGYGYSDFFLDERFMGKSISIDEDGVLCDLFVEYDPQLKFADDYFSLDENYLTYESVGNHKGDFSIYSVSFSKKGSRISADEIAETDQLEVHIADENVDWGWAFLLTFEKK